MYKLIGSSHDVSDEAWRSAGLSLLNNAFDRISDDLKNPKKARSELIRSRIGGLSFEDSEEAAILFREVDFNGDHVLDASEFEELFELLLPGLPRLLTCRLAYFYFRAIAPPATNAVDFLTFVEKFKEISQK